MDPTRLTSRRRYCRIAEQKNTAAILVETYILSEIALFLILAIELGLAYDEGFRAGFEQIRTSKDSTKSACMHWVLA